MVSITHRLVSVLWQLSNPVQSDLGSVASTSGFSMQSEHFLLSSVAFDTQIQDSAACIVACDIDFKRMFKL